MVVMVVSPVASTSQNVMEVLVPPVLLSPMM
jgi:hypothetical protein